MKQFIKKMMGYSLGIVALCGGIPLFAKAGVFEIGGGFSYSRKLYNSESDYNSTRTWGLSVGYWLNEKSQVEVSFQDSVEKTFITGYEDTEFHDQIYSLNWVQGFLAKTSFFQPYVKLGFGQLNRTATGSRGGYSPPALVDALTGIIGVGMKFGITQNLSLKLEGTTYLQGGSLRSWQDNIATNIGFSFMF